MKNLIIASAVVLALAAPLAASAETFTNGTSTTTGTQSVSGHLVTSSVDKICTDGFQISVQGSLQAVKSVSVDGTLSMNNLTGAGAVTKQIDGSIALNASKFNETSVTKQNFDGHETSSSATASSSAFTSISPN